MIQASAVCSRSNSLTWISPWRAVDRQWIRFIAVARRVGPDGRRQRRRLERPLGRGVAALEAGRRQPPQRQRLDPRVDDDADPLADRRRRLEEAERVAGPDVQRLDPEVAAPGQRGADRATSARSRPPSVIARPGRPPGSVVGLWTSSQGLGMRLAVAQRVGHPHPVADVAVELADRVARLEVGQAEADQRRTTRR